MPDWRTPSADVGSSRISTLLLLDRIENHRPGVTRLIEPSLAVRSTTERPGAALPSAVTAG